MGAYLRRALRRRQLTSLLGRSLIFLSAIITCDEAFDCMERLGGISSRDACDFKYKTDMHEDLLDYICVESSFKSFNDR